MQTSRTGFTGLPPAARIKCVRALRLMILVVCSPEYSHLLWPISHSRGNFVHSLLIAILNKKGTFKHFQDFWLQTSPPIQEAPVKTLTCLPSTWIKIEQSTTWWCAS